MIEDGKLWDFALAYCEGRRDRYLNSIKFARDFCEAYRETRPEDMEMFCIFFYERYEKTYMRFVEIIGKA